MKHLLTLMIAGLFLVSCSNSAKKGMTNGNKTNQQSQRDELSLEDVLRKTSGVHVLGSGKNLSVRVRFPGTFKSSTAPIFIVNGNPIGNSYNAAVNLVKGKRIKTVQALIGSQATYYDLRGESGVILIETH